MKFMAQEEDVHLQVIKPNHKSLLHFSTRIKCKPPHKPVEEMATTTLLSLLFLTPQIQVMYIIKNLFGNQENRLTKEMKKL